MRVKQTKSHDCVNSILAVGVHAHCCAMDKMAANRRSLPRRTRPPARVERKCALLCCVYLYCTDMFNYGASLSRAKARFALGILVAFLVTYIFFFLVCVCTGTYCRWCVIKEPIIFFIYSSFGDCFPPPAYPTASLPAFLFSVENLEGMCG